MDVPPVLRSGPFPGEFDEACDAVGHIVNARPFSDGVGVVLATKDIRAWQSAFGQERSVGAAPNRLKVRC